MCSSDLVCRTDLALPGDRLKSERSVGSVTGRRYCRHVVFLRGGEYRNDGWDVSDRRHSLAVDELRGQRDGYDDGLIGIVVEREAQTVEFVLLSRACVLRSVMDGVRRVVALSHRVTARMVDVTDLGIAPASVAHPAGSVLAD